MLLFLFTSSANSSSVEFIASESGQIDQIKLGMKFDEVEKIYGARAEWKQGANEPYLVVNLSKTCHVRLGSKEFGMVVRIAIPQACIQTFDGLTHGLSYNEFLKTKNQVGKIHRVNSLNYMRALAIRIMKLHFRSQLISITGN